MTKREFMIQYVISRASTIPGTIDGPGVARAASDIWDIIVKKTPEETLRHPSQWKKEEEEIWPR